MVLRYDCVHSLAVLMPCPQIVKCTSQHAYITLSSFLQHGLLFPSGEKGNNKYQPVIKSYYAQKVISICKNKILHEFHLLSLIALIICWFDDWDASTCLTKANKNSIFTGVNTVVFVTVVSGKVYSSYTNVSCVGRKRSNHQPILDSMPIDIKDMQNRATSNQMLSSMDNRWYKVYPAFLYLLADQPARRGLCGMLGGNSTLHACFGYSINFDSLKKPFPACKHCASLLFKNINPITCNKCSFWELPDSPNQMQLQYTEELHPGLLTKIETLHKLNNCGGKLSFSLFKKVWRECYEDFTSSSLTSRRTVLSNMKKKLLLICMNKETLDAFISSLIAENTLPKFPVLWNYIHMDQMVEATMHLSAGVIKSIAELVHDWAHKFGNNKQLTDHMEGCIGLFSKFSSINSYWLAPYSKSNKFPGWIADTFRTWNKLMPWLYSCIRFQKFGFCDYVPVGNVTKWKKADCSKFLLSRGFKVNSNHNVHQLRKNIQRVIKANKNRIPEHKRSLLQTILPKEITRLIWYCHLLFKMFFDTENACDVQHHILVTKQFLSSVHSITHRLYYGNGEKSFYLKKYNFVSLLRGMIDGKKNWTSGKYIHEGGIEGEGMVKELRPLLPNNLRNDFAVNLIKKNIIKMVLRHFCPF